MRRLLPTIAVLAVLAAACGDALGGVGDLSRDFVHGETTTTTSTTIVQSPSLNLSGITGLTWVNDVYDDFELLRTRQAGSAYEGEVAVAAFQYSVVVGESFAGDYTVVSLGEAGGTFEYDGWEFSSATGPMNRNGTEEVIDSIFARGGGGDVIQSSRREIASALPGLEFPRLVPSNVTHISSQLVYDRLSGDLAISTAAQFGLWSGQPFATPIAEGQIAVLRVGFGSFNDLPPGEFRSLRLANGREVSWVKGDYLYQLQCRTGVSEEACFTMAEAMSPLAILSIIGE